MKVIVTQFGPSGKLSGPEIDPASGIIGSLDLKKIDYPKFKFSGPWAKLIGSPATNFDMMVHGAPGNGKTVFLLKFAKYLAEKHKCNVLYISTEEFGSVTLAEKVDQFKIASPNLFFAPNLSALQGSNFDVVFIDSVNDCGLIIPHYKELRKVHPNTAFVLILQTRKDGKFRGSQEWPHEVEIVVEVSNREGICTKNRYGVMGALMGE